MVGGTVGEGGGGGLVSCRVARVSPRRGARCRGAARARAARGGNLVNHVEEETEALVRVLLLVREDGLAPPVALERCEERARLERAPAVLPAPDVPQQRTQRVHDAAWLQPAVVPRLSPVRAPRRGPRRRSPRLRARALRARALRARGGSGCGGGGRRGRAVGVEGEEEAAGEGGGRGRGTARRR